MIQRLIYHPIQKEILVQPELFTLLSFLQGPDAIHQETQTVKIRSAKC